MEIKNNNGVYSVSAKEYALEVSQERILVLVDGEEVANLRTASAVNSFKDENVVEDTTDPSALGFEKTDDGFIWTREGGLWEKTEFIVKLTEEYFTYAIKVKGNGPVDSVNYFIGSPEADWRGSDYEFDRGYMPIPTVDGTVQNEFPAQKSYDEFSYLTVPPLFCYVFDVCGLDKKIAFGLLADKGQHNFTKYTYNTHVAGGYLINRFWLATDQDCHTVVDGEWTTPSIMVFPAKDRYGALQFYADKYFETGAAERKPAYDIPRFWYGPMACGWVEQWAQDVLYDMGCGMVHSCRQEVYDRYISELEKRDMHPHIMIIDDKWQKEYATAVVSEDKWPDFRGWIDKALAEHNIHTMLWYKLWDSEGLPEDATMLDANNNPVADPTSPAYRAILKENMHRLLSSDEGCYNAYGLKLDYAFMQPVGRHCKSYSGAYGVELYYEYLKLIWETVKEVKEEAIVSGSPCHPYLNRYIDHARLHDYHPDLRRCLEEFEYRGTIYSIANPDALIDTDGAGFRTRRDTMRHLVGASKIGIPDVYCITEMPTLKLSDEDWAQVAKAWKDYSDKIDEMYK